MAEWAHTDERDDGRTATRLATLLAEGAWCRSGTIIGGRFERTNRPEEDPLADPFRTPRPASDLNNLGVSVWTTLTASISARPRSVGGLTGSPFLEIARMHAEAGN